MSGKPKAWKAKDEERYIVATRTLDGIAYGCQILPEEQSVTREEPIDTIARFQPYTNFVPCDPPQQVLDLAAKAKPPILSTGTPRPWTES